MLTLRWMIVLLSVLVAMPTRAQDDAPPAEYGGLVDSALSEFEAQHWPEARALFERAHLLYPNARTLRGVGMAAFELRDYVAARRALELSLTDSRRALTAEQRAQVSELVSRARVFVGDFRLGPAPIGTVIDVDGAPATLDGDIATQASLPLAVGAHVVTMRAPDGRTAQAQVTVHGGETTTLALTIPDHVPVAAAAPEVVPATPVAPAPIATAPSWSPPAWAWGVAITGGVLVIAGAVLLGVGVSDASTVSNASRGTEWADLAGPYARATPLEVTGGIALGLGVVAAAIGIVGLVVPIGETTRVSIGPGSLLVRGTF